MTTPPDSPSDRPRKRSRLFKAAPNALQVDEWIPNITLPPPPRTPLEEDDTDNLLDEHGLPQLPDGEEPEEVRRGPARVYVGEGAKDAGTSQVLRDELPVAAPELTDLRLPSVDRPLDSEEDSLEGMPDLSIDGSGQDWGDMHAAFEAGDVDDDEEPTDSELIAAAASSDLAEPVPQLSLPISAVAPPEAEPAAPAPAPAPEPPAPSTPTAEPKPPAAPSWARPAKASEPNYRAPAGKVEPPRIRASKPKAPEPTLGTLVPRSLIIAVVVLVIVVVVVLVFQRPGPVLPDTQPVGAQPHEVTINPGTLDLGAASPPAASDAPVKELELEPEAELEAEVEAEAELGTPEPLVTQPEPAPEPRRQTTPSQTTPSTGSSTADSSSTRSSPIATSTTPSRPQPVSALTPEPEATGPGFLVVQSDRYAMVYMGGRRLGGTPIARMELELGAYAVRAVCRDTGSTKTLQVEIEPGELTTASFKFMP